MIPLMAEVTASSAVQSFGNELRQHRKQLEEEMHRIARELKEMQVEVAGEDNIAQLSKRSRTLPAHRIRTIAANEERIQDPQRKYSAMSSRKSSSKRHISSTPINKSRDKPEVAVAKNSTRDSDSDSQPEVTEHSSCLLYTSPSPRDS